MHHDGGGFAIFLGALANVLGIPFKSLVLWAYTGCSHTLANVAATSRACSYLGAVWCEGCQRHVRCNQRRIVRAPWVYSAASLAANNAHCWEGTRGMVPTAPYAWTHLRQSTNSIYSSTFPAASQLDEIIRVCMYHKHRRSCRCGDICGTGIVAGHIFH